MWYRFTLHEIHCLHQRGRDKYRDALHLTFAFFESSGPNDDPTTLASRNSVLGIAGPKRWSPLFGPGTKVSLAPDPNRWGLGFDKAWYLDVDVPDDKQIKLSVNLLNVRGVSDPYAISRWITRALTAIAFTVSGKVAVQHAVTETAAWLYGLAYGGGEFVADTILENLFPGSDWEDCSGEVFHTTWDFNLSALKAEKESSVWLRSDRKYPSENRCGIPEYEVQLSWTPMSALWPDFGKVDKTVETGHGPVVKANSADWVGIWIAGSQSDPTVSVSIESSAEISVADKVILGPAPRRYDVTITEKLTDGSLIHDTTRATSLTPELQELIKYTPGDRQATRKAVPLPSFVHHETSWRISQVARAGTTRLLTLEDDNGRSITAEARPELWGSIDKTAAPNEIEITKVIDENPVYLLATEEVLALTAADLDITLSLYTRTDTMRSGTEARGTVLRYVRGAGKHATAAYFELHKLRKGNDPV